nr:cell surface glycoprotein CD200 receptor 2-like [Pelodiscus sinensis]|eukprot:XP_025041032.1 cell surface glycoprotein CD200 receptor 2-like [Pelodiscus sinensis]
MAQMWPILAELFLFLMKVVPGPVDNTVSAVVGTKAVLRCPNISVSSLILVVWHIRPKNGSHCLLAHRADTKTDRTNCTKRITWESYPAHDPTLQIHPVRLADEGNYICEIATSDGNLDQVSALIVLVPPVVTLTHESNEVVVCQASAGKPAGEISWAQGSGHSTENKTHHTNGTVTILSRLSLINSTNAYVTCLVTHPALNQTIELSPEFSADVTLSPTLYYFLISTSSCVAVAVIVLISYRTLKCRGSATSLSGMANTATMPNTTENKLKFASRPEEVNTSNSYATESIYQNYSVQRMYTNVNSVKTQRQRV